MVIIDEMPAGLILWEKLVVHFPLRTLGTEELFINTWDRMTMMYSGVLCDDSENL